MAFSDRRVILRAVLAATLISAVGLGACGRKGALEPPPRADVTTSPNAPANTESGKPDRGFPLDFLL